MNLYYHQKRKNILIESVEDFMISYLLKAKENWRNNMVNYIQALQELDIFNTLWIYDLFLNSAVWKDRDGSQKNILRTWVMKVNSYINYQSIQTNTFNPELTFNDSAQSIWSWKYSIEKYINKNSLHDFYLSFSRDHVVALPRRMSTLKIILSSIYKNTPKSFRILDIGWSLGIAKQVLTHWIQSHILDNKRRQHLISLKQELIITDFEDSIIEKYCVIDKSCDMSSKNRKLDSRNRATAWFWPVWVNLEYMKYNQIIQNLQEIDNTSQFLLADALDQKQLAWIGTFNILFLSFSLFEMDIDYNFESQKIFELWWNYLEEEAYIIIQDISLHEENKWLGKIPVLVYKKKSEWIFQYIWSPITLSPDQSMIAEVNNDILNNLT